MFILTFQYFNDYDEVVERTVHGDTKDDVISKAYDYVSKEGYGDIKIISLENMYE